MKELIIPTICIIIWFFVVLFIMGGSDNRADLSQDGGYEPCSVPGHPLYTDC